MNDTYDYIVVGAGSSGATLASRLAESGARRVLLLEAGGPDDSRWIRIPLGVARLMNDLKYTWPFNTEPQTHLNGKPQYWARGKVLGGSGAINGNVYVRGDPEEFDSWQGQGVEGWGWNELTPYFKRIEDYERGDPDKRGRGGPIGITKLQDFDALSAAFLKACGEAGIPEAPDYNDGNYRGHSFMQYSTRNGRRSSAGIEYLRPAMRRPNLTVITHAHAARVLLEGRRATGIEFLVDGERRSALASREVLLSAGPMMSPALLERSGIGDAAILARHGIASVHHLPGVGENLSDHPQSRLTFECSKPITINDVMRSRLRMMLAGMEYVFLRKGLLSISSSTAIVFTNSNPRTHRSDLKIQFHPLSGRDRYARTPEKGLDPFPGFSIGVFPLLPRSRGYVHIRSADPMALPAMDPRYLSHEADAQCMVDGMRIARRIAQQPAMQPMIVRETRPGPDATDDNAILDYIKDTAQTSWHQVGTCKIGKDPMAVVDSELRVHGIERLRVIDSSVCPTVPSSNTNAISIVIGEKGADLVLKAAS